VITDAGHFQRRTLRTTVFHVITSFGPRIHFQNDQGGL
jgi:hypothetical protein